MKLWPTIILVLLSACGPQLPSKKIPTKSEDAQPRVSNPKLDEAARHLLRHQEENFDEILKELKENEKKISHWIWWVFPTDAPGNSEPSPKSKVSIKTAEAVLARADLKKWTLILERIALLLEKNSLASGFPNPLIMPSIDHGRVAYALDFWLRTVGEKSKKYPRFFEALQRLDKFKWR